MATTKEIKRIEELIALTKEKGDNTKKAEIEKTLNQLINQ